MARHFDDAVDNLCKPEPPSRLSQPDGNRLGKQRQQMGLDEPDQPSFEVIEPKLTEFLKSRLSGLKMDSMLVMDDRVTLHYRYRRRSRFDWAAFTNELNQIDNKVRVEVFVG